MSTSPPTNEINARTWTEIAITATRFIVTNHGNDQIAIAFGDTAPTDVRGFFVQPGDQSKTFESETKIWVYVFGSHGGQVAINEVA